MTAHVLVDGKRLWSPVEVETWHETELEFPHLRWRRETRLVVLHWTASENPPDRVHANMTTRGLSVHFVVDQLGVAYQMADARALCAHASGANEAGVGIEIVNRGHDTDVPTRGFERVLRSDQVHGRMLRYGDFFDAQKLTVLGLCRALTSAYGLPFRVPTVKGQVVRGVLPKAQLDRFTGIIGHYHTRKDKVDPAPALLQWVAEQGDGSRSLA